jgi:hypothetical protein
MDLPVKTRLVHADYGLNTLNYFGIGLYDPNKKC